TVARADPGAQGAAVRDHRPTAAGKSCQEHLLRLVRGADSTAVYDAVFAASQKALRGYRPKPYSGRIVFFHAVKSSLVGSRHIAADWSRFAEGGVESIDIPADHLSMLEAPALAILIAEFRRCIGALDPAVE